ncbi:MAG: hypothetical protein KY462_06050 [Actinobacteria bacterium]|nr:hypothetical protein [Actinomycetota bacterium]
MGRVDRVASPFGSSPKQRLRGPASKALRAVDTAPTVDAAERQIEEFKTAWGGQSR